MLKKISTVARVKLFYVACSKNGFLPWTMENDQRQLLAQFRSTSNSDISSGALLVVLQDICFPPLRDLNTHKKNRQFAILADNSQVGAILDTDLHSNKVSSQPQNGADAVRRRACSLRPVETDSISSRRSSMIVDLGLGCTSTYNTSLQLSFECVDFEV